MSNLESFLDQGNNAGKELKMRAIEILTELAFDWSINLTTETKENLIKKQLQIFLADDEGEEEKLRITVGKSLALLSKMKTIFVFIMMEQNNVVDRLKGILDAGNITYRTVALEILENLCTHCTLDKDYVKEALMPKVIKEILASTRYPPIETQAIPGLGNDEENQLMPKRSGQIKAPDQANEELKAKMELQEALLSLALVMCDELISADDLDDVVREISLREGEFLQKLMAIVNKNCEATTCRLRIVKLCGQIVVLMLQRNRVTARLKDYCVESLQKASGIMSNLESCMLFAGTDWGAKRTARPLLSDIVKKARELVETGELVGN